MSTTNKHKEVLKHLQKKKTITSMEAIEQYRATRLAAIIFDLRKRYNIDTLMIDDTDLYGNRVRYAKYRYRGKKAE